MAENSQSEQQGQQVERNEREVAFEAGQLIVRENKLNKKMYIILSGKVRVFKTYMNRKVTLAVLGQGEIFGELSFFDAAPRSASVEALVSCRLLEIDGDEANRQIESLPKWVLPVIRKILQRFRLADQKITVLESVKKKKKSVSGIDSFNQAVYLELTRYLKTLELICSNSNPETTEQEILTRLDEVLGNKTISLKSFWKVLEENHLVTINILPPSPGSQPEGSEKKPFRVELHLDLVEPLIGYLNNEAESGRYLILSHTAIAILCRIVGLAEFQSKLHKQKSENEKIEISKSDLKLDNLPLSTNGIKELSSMIEFRDGIFIFNSKEILQHYLHQSVLKNFDRSVMLAG